MTALLLRLFAMDFLFLAGHFVWKGVTSVVYRFIGFIASPGVALLVGRWGCAGYKAVLSYALCCAVSPFFSLIPTGQGIVHVLFPSPYFSAVSKARIPIPS